jgi:heterodisulfide reductase subunit C/nitrate reductase gamma subunit
MLFNVTLHLALAAFFFGLAWRLWTWLNRDFEASGTSSRPMQRLRAAITGIAQSFTSLDGLRRLAAAVFLDGIFQRRVLRESLWRWLAHQGVFWGFVLLILFHALQKQVSEELFANYYSTLYPFPLLRDILGLAVFLGLLGFAWRRWADPVVRRATRVWADVAILVLLAIIILSGFGLKAVKITSQARFDEMAEEYAGLEPGPELSALQAYWQQEYGVVFAKGPLATDPETMELGEEATQSYCIDCHSRPQEAFGSYALSRVLKPAAVALNSVRADHLLWLVHYLACFLALAILPFSKLLHIITTPLSLVVDAIMGRSSASEQAQPAARAARLALALDACTGCGTCSQHCSVLAASKVIGEDVALPSLKLAAMAGLKRKSSSELSLMRRGADLCTRCQRCTRVCPAGIDLQDLWLALDDEMESRGRKPVYEWARGKLVDNHVANGANGDAAKHETLAVPGETRQLGVLDMALQQGYFRYCFQCQTCSNVCPVVSCFEHPGKSLGLLPHQIMYSLELGLVKQAVAAAMTWDCATCYQCQENCPQGVPVTDLLYELRSQGFWFSGDREPARKKEGEQS